MCTSPTTRTRPSNVAPRVAAHAIDGSKVHVHYNGISENLHFFTDHAASVILNPNELPFSMASLDYIQLMSESIGARCNLDESAASYKTMLTRWAQESYNQKKRIDSVLNLRSANSGNTVVLSDVQLERIQNILLDQVLLPCFGNPQMCLAGKRLGLLLTEVYSAQRIAMVCSWMCLLLMTLLLVLHLIKKHNKKVIGDNKRRASMRFDTLPLNSCVCLIRVLSCSVSDSVSDSLSCSVSDSLSNSLHYSLNEQPLLPTAPVQHGEERLLRDLHIPDRPQLLLPALLRLQ